MNIDEYNKLKDQVEEKFQETIKSAEKERKEALDAIEKVWSLLSETVQKNITVPIEQKSLHPINKSDYGSLTTSIKECIKRLPEKFDKTDVILVLPQISPELARTIKQTSLSGCLKRLEKQGYIETYKQGSGSIPITYKKLSKFELFKE